MLLSVKLQVPTANTCFKPLFFLELFSNLFVSGDPFIHLLIKMFVPVFILFWIFSKFARLNIRHFSNSRIKVGREYFVILGSQDLALTSSTKKP